MTVITLYVSSTGTVVGVLTEAAAPAGASPTPQDLAGSDFPFRVDGNDVPIHAGLLGIASIDPAGMAGMEGVFGDPGGYKVVFGSGGKPKLACAANPSGSVHTLSRTNGITIKGTGIPAGAAAVAVLQDTTTLQAAPVVLPGTTTAGQFQATASLAPGPWHVAWFITDSRPGTSAGLSAT
jgi:hypothetical protein